MCYAFMRPLLVILPKVSPPVKKPLVTRATALVTFVVLRPTALATEFDPMVVPVVLAVLILKMGTTPLFDPPQFVVRSVEIVLSVTLLPPVTISLTTPPPVLAHRVSVAFTQPAVVVDDYKLLRLIRHPPPPVELQNLSLGPFVVPSILPVLLMVKCACVTVLTPFLRFPSTIQSTPLLLPTLVDLQPPIRHLFTNPFRTRFVRLQLALMKMYPLQSLIISLLIEWPKNTMGIP